LGGKNGLNPLTNVPYAKDLTAGEDNAHLSQERAVSSIPKAVGSQHVDNGGCLAGQQGTGHWMYPSSQMFYAAMKRKGHETAAEDVDVMVAIHNALNENVWQQVLQWEKRK
jgi:cytochrome c heme-lyase